MSDYVVLEYLYRDANNFKAFGEVLLAGHITESYVSEIESLLLYNEIFVAEQVGVPVLYEELWKFSNGPTLADHAFHEYVRLRPANHRDLETTPEWGSTDKFLESFRNANHKWDCSLSVHANI